MPSLVKNFGRRFSLESIEINESFKLRSLTLVMERMQSISDLADSLILMQEAATLWVQLFFC